MLNPLPTSTVSEEICTKIKSTNHISIVIMIAILPAGNLDDARLERRRGTLISDVKPPPCTLLKSRCIYTTHITSNVRFGKGQCSAAMVGARALANLEVTDPDLVPFRDREAWR